MIDRLVIFGATGDLTGRYLLPGLAALAAGGRLPSGFQLIGASREDWTDDEFRRWARERLSRHGGGPPPEAMERVVASARYAKADVTDAGEVGRVLAGTGPLAAYLALPPFLFPAAVSALHGAGLAAGSTVVLEKPFGESLQEAIELNRLLAQTIPEEEVFRVDHFLAMSTVQNILGTRLGNRLLEPVWNSTHIEEVEIVWDETVALEGRAGYYDGVGALKDLVQNHLLQVMCLVAMEPPVSSSERDLRDRKLDVLRSVRPLGEPDVARRTRRARYGAGHVGDRAVPAYAEEEGVDPALGTETYAEVKLELESWRWTGTTFRLRTGKAMGRDRMEVAVRFREVPHLPFPGVPDPAPNVLRFGLDPETLDLELTGAGPGPSLELTPLTLRAQLPPALLPAYGRLLLDVLNDDPTLSIRGDEAEESWRIVDPVVAAWSRNLVPLEEYPAGSEGPARKPS
ncbi:MAG: glucose-6-phosphate dehydrogenase [Candidatus Dormibacteraeota bacterium]|nr:glucose-6-phosphate dehydrogenase [Candidatus Dormibacteraeota bacterium]